MGAGRGVSTRETHHFVVSPSRSAWPRHHQQPRASHCSMFSIQVAGVVALTLLLLLVAALMRPGRRSEQQAADRPWASYNADQVLSLLGMAPTGAETAMHRKTRQRGGDELERSGWGASQGSREVRGVADVNASADPPAAEEIREGLVRLVTDVEHPLGRGGPEENPLCAAFRGSQIRSLAVVGNGPIDEAQRQEIDTFDMVVRFNLMNNWRRFAERVDVWVIRFSTEAKLRYWGITNLSPADAVRVLGLMKAVWLVGGERADAEELVAQVPAALGAHPVLIPQEPFAAAYSALMNVSDGSPSTGFAGLRAVLLCTPDSLPIHIYGFNWHGRMWQGHKVASEKAFLEALVPSGRVVIHDTTCYGQRECGPGDHDQSCHWGSDSKYYCLRGKPRQWVDLTATLGPGRLQEYLGPGEGSDRAVQDA